MKDCKYCQKEFEEKKSYEVYCSIQCARKYQNEIRREKLRTDPEYKDRRNRLERERRANGGRDKVTHAKEEKIRYRKKHGINSDADLKCAPKGSGCLTTFGYRKIHKKGHPNCWKSGDMFEHVYIMSEHLGRPIRKGETVHHKNGIKHDNHIDNLELWSSSHPYGQRVEDKLEWCKKFLESYGYDIKKKKNKLVCNMTLGDKMKQHDDSRTGTFKSGGQRIDDHKSWMGAPGKNSRFPDGPHKTKDESSAQGVGSVSKYEDTTEAIKGVQMTASAKVKGHKMKEGYFH